MPIYRYNCSDCNTQFDKLINSISKRDIVSCVHCSSLKTERRLSAPNVCSNGESGSLSDCNNNSGFS